MALHRRKVGLGGKAGKAIRDFMKAKTEIRSEIRDMAIVAGTVRKLDLQDRHRQGVMKDLINTKTGITIASGSSSMDTGFSSTMDRGPQSSKPASLVAISGMNVAAFLKPFMQLTQVERILVVLITIVMILFGLFGSYIVHVYVLFMVTLFFMVYNV